VRPAYPAIRVPIGGVMHTHAVPAFKVSIEIA